MRTEVNPLTAPRVHLEVRILFQILDCHERLSFTQSEPRFGTDVVAAQPTVRDHLSELAGACAPAQRAAQIHATNRV